MPAFSTRNARVEVGTASVPTQRIRATRWSVEIRSDEIDVTNFETGGFAEFLPGYVEATFSVDGFWERGGFPFQQGGILVAAGNLVEVTLYAHRSTDNDDWFYFPQAFILSCAGESAVRDAARVSFTGRNFGEFQYPLGLVFSGVDPDGL